MKSPGAYLAAFFMTSAVLFAGSFDPEAAIAALPKGQAASLRIPEGTYRLPATGLRLKDLKDVVIEGERAGARLIVTDFTKNAITLAGCKNTTLRNITIDCDPLPFTQGTITSVDTNDLSFDFTIHTGYPDLTAPYLSNSFHLFDPVERHWKKGASDYYGILVERLSKGKGRVFLKPDSGVFNAIAVGDRIVLPVKKAVAVFLTDCDNTVFENVTIHAAAGAAVIGRFCEAIGAYRRLRVVPGPKPEGATEERLLSTCADAFNIAYTRRGPVLENCEFSYQGDDSVNLHGVVFPVLKWFDEKTFLTMRPGKEPFEKLVRPGDDVRFLHEPNYAILASAKITSMERSVENMEQWKEYARKTWTTFSEPKEISFFRIQLAEKVTGITEGALCEIPATSAPEHIIRNSFFHDHRARGLRLMSENGLVENNRFERIKGAAISIGPEFAYWREAGWCRNVIVRGNQIKDVGQGTNLTKPDSYTLGAICVTTSLLRDDRKPGLFPGNEKILISGNTIDGFPLDGINIASAHGVTVENNTIRNVNLQLAGDAGRAFGLAVGQPISVTGGGAEIRGNTILPDHR